MFSRKFRVCSSLQIISGNQRQWLSVWGHRDKWDIATAPKEVWVSARDVHMGRGWEQQLMARRERQGGMWARACALTHILLSVTPGTVARQAFLSMGFTRQESWSRSPCHPPGDLSSPEVEPVSAASPALAGRFSTAVRPGKPSVNPATLSWAELCPCSLRAFVAVLTQNLRNVTVLGDKRL